MRQQVPERDGLLLSEVPSGTSQGGLVGHPRRPQRDPWGPTRARPETLAGSGSAGGTRHVK